MTATAPIGLPTTGGFTKTDGWLDWYQEPSTPRFELPPGAVDAHCHVFGPGAQYPYAAARKYTPCDASAAELLALRDRLGFSRNVIVQATCHGADNSALVGALGEAGGRARGVATVRPDVTESELEELHQAGVRGVRFNFVRRLVDLTPPEDLATVVRKIAPLGWHVVIYFEAADLAGLQDFFLGIPVPLVIDHMGRPDVTADVAGPEFGAFLDFLRARDDIWCKVTCPERLTVSGPPALSGERAAYQDVVPFARTVVQEFPDRVLWGTDWPHPNLKGHMPDDGLLVDGIPQIATTPGAQRALLVDNPMRLYWPEETR
ncbi:MAG: amidohydrolase family protein [Phycicoccus sp.]|nr:amidohydrolase family protein [Phycicoccus sp.]